jgi:macrolide transport system ATP-binding/permease protein
MALGAQRQHVLRLVMVESMFLVAIGIGIGIAVALGAGQLVSTLLFGLPPSDVPSIAGAIGVMVLVSAVAGYLPARRASRVDPMVALHYD